MIGSGRIELDGGCIGGRTGEKVGPSLSEPDSAR